MQISEGRSNEVPRFSIDYCFLGRPKGAEELKRIERQLLHVMVMVDQVSGCMFSAVVSKDVHANSLHVATEGLNFAGREMPSHDGRSIARSCYQVLRKLLKAPSKHVAANELSWR